MKEDFVELEGITQIITTKLDDHYESVILLAMSPSWKVAKRIEVT